MTSKQEVNSKTSRPQPTAGPPYSETWNIKSPSGYQISEHLLNDPPSALPGFRIVIAGAGPSGIDCLHLAAKELKPLGIELARFEKNADVGETWYRNRYPGCGCDIPSVCYQYTWRPKPDWTKFYSRRDEIWQYFKDTVVEGGLDQYITCNTEIKKAVWNDTSSKWEITVTKLDDDGESIEIRKEECDYFVNATGFLSAWKIPDIKGLHSFQGVLMHSATYDARVDLKEKRVAVVGSGSSGIQLVAEIQKDVKELYIWIRSPTWVTLSFAQAYAGENGANFEYSAEQREQGKEEPKSYLKYRKMVEKEMNHRFKFLLKDTKEAEAVKNVILCITLLTIDVSQVVTKDMSTKLGHDPRLIEKIIPKTFNVGCRRPSPGPGYLEALITSNMTVYTNEIEEITRKGFLDPEGHEVVVDVIICATGFDTSFIPRFPIIGLNGTDIRSLWKDNPLSYLSLGAPHIPNYFIYLSPYGPLAHGSAITISEALSQYLVQVIKKIRSEHIKRLSPSVEATADFVEHASLYVQRTAWTGNCRSWFKQGSKDGPVLMWPGSRLHFFEAMRRPRFEDYDIEYFSGSRFGFFGNAFSAKEFDGSDTTYYMGADEN